MWRRLLVAVLAAGSVVVAASHAVGPSPAGPATLPQSAPDAAPRSAFLEMFARGYFPGRSGQVLIVPREGTILTRNESSATYMHGSPWPYDRRLPLMFAGDGVTPGVYDTPAAHQDVAVTIASALGTSMPPTATGRVLAPVRPSISGLRAVLLVVLDGMRYDYFDRYASIMPTLTALRKNAAWFSAAGATFLPTNTGAAHATIATGGEPRVHGITGNNLYDRARRTRHDLLAGWHPRDLMALTLADVWQFATAGRARIVAQGSSVPAGVALAGHGACQLGGVAVVHAGYDETAGAWRTNPACFTLPGEVGAFAARSYWPSDGLWMGHRVDNPSELRRSGLFPRLEADVFIRLIETQGIGEDAVADLLLLNYKTADYVGHKYGPDSAEIRAALGELDRNFGRILRAVETRVGKDYLVAVTADHGMPGEPKAPQSRQFAPDIVTMIHRRFDPAGQLVTYYEPENAQIFVDLDRLRARGLSLRDLADFLEDQPFVYAAFTDAEVQQAARALR